MQDQIGGSYTDQLGSSDWLGGPQNGNETPSEKKAPKGSLGAIKLEILRLENEGRH
jgi:hypothetical protein